MDKFADSIGSFFSGGDQIPWCDRDSIVGCEREVAEAKKNGSDELKNESIMRLSWALVHSKQSKDVQRGIARLEVDPDTARISEVKAWVASQLEAAGKEAPEFEYTPLSVGHLYNLASVSQAKTQAANIIAADFRQKAAEYRSQAARIKEILENVGLAQESLASNVVSSTLVLANVANLLNIRDTELSSFLVAMGDLSLRKTAVEEKRAKVEKESKILLDYTRKAIARLTYLKSIHKQLEDDVAPCQKQMEDWKTSLVVMASKERQYLQQYNNYKALLNRVGYTPEISHGVLVEMAECRKELEKKTKPILDTLRSYQDLPPDKALAALAIEDKKRQYAAAEKYLEDVLHSALATND